MTTKRLIALALLCAALFTAGCTSSSNGGSSIQNVLSRYLPPDFVGDVEIHHNNPYVPGLDINAGNVRKENGRWVYDWLAYNRVGHVSNGWVYIGPVPDSRRR